MCVFSIDTSEENDSLFFHTEKQMQIILINLILHFSLVQCCHPIELDRHESVLNTLIAFDKMTSPYDRARSISWSDDQTLKLIELYKSYPSLWDGQHSDYGKRSTNYSSFYEISQQLGFREEDVKVKIRSLRIKFDQCHLAWMKTPDRTVDWSYFKPMAFLAKTYRKPEEKYNAGFSRNTTRADDTNRTENNGVGLPVSNGSLAAPLAEPEPPRDRIDQFYLAMAGLVKHFPREMLYELNAKIVASISEMETKLAKQDNRHSNAAASTSNGRDSSAASTSNRDN